MYGVNVFDKLKEYVDIKIGNVREKLKDLFDEYKLKSIFEIKDDIVHVAKADKGIADFSMHFLGSFDKEPVDRGNGEELVIGDMYFNLSKDVMYIYVKDGNGNKVWVEINNIKKHLFETKTIHIDKDGVKVVDIGEYDYPNTLVHLNGLLLDRDNDYNKKSNTEIEFSDELKKDDEIIVIKVKTVELSNLYSKEAIDEKLGNITTESISSDGELEVNKGDSKSTSILKKDGENQSEIVSIIVEPSEDNDIDYDITISDSDGNILFYQESVDGKYNNTSVIYIEYKNRLNFKITNNGDDNKFKFTVKSILLKIKKD